MADGTRRRRFSPITAKRRWYARHRATRFAERFGGIAGTVSTPAPVSLATDDNGIGELEAATVDFGSVVQLHSAWKWNSVVSALHERLAIA
jgi:hypothetical protein